MKKEIARLQERMREEGINAYYVACGDPHGSEYLNAHYQTCEYLSGLHSEAADLIVTSDGAYLWTDGRFFLQAEIQLAGSGIELMRKGEPDVPEMQDFVKDLASAGSGAPFVLAMDGSTTSASMGIKFEEALKASGCAAELRWDRDIAGGVWEDRPSITPSRIWELPLSSAGKTAAEKIADMREAMQERNADRLVLSDLMETAWLLNLRGGDIDYTPVFFSYIVLTYDDVDLYVMDGALEGELPDGLSFVRVRDYSEIFDDVAAFPEGSTVWLSADSASYALWKSVPESCSMISDMTPAARAKTVKNETEISSTINAHIKDGAAVVKFIRWIKDIAGKEPQTEISASDYLAARRFEQDGCFDLSFPSIAGYMANGAIIHYMATPETDTAIKPEGFFLVDSGGQYIDGTTDITRTIAMGPLTEEMIRDYTLVLRCHIDLSRAVIEPGKTTYDDLNDIARQPLRDYGIEYNHGVSHGVGHVLAVHEGPAGIRRAGGLAELLPGMIISNEPGVYLEGRFGVRIENEILLREGPDGTVVSEPITVVPYERDAIDAKLLTDEELSWLNDYHARVRETLLPLLDGEDADYLIHATQPISRM